MGSAPLAASPELKPRRAGLPRMQEMGLVVVIVLLSLFLWLGSDNVERVVKEKQVKNAAGQVVQTLPEMTVRENKFFRTANLVPSVFTVMSWMAIMALGATVVIIAGGIDISVGSIMGLAALGCAAAIQNMPENASAWRVLPVALAAPLGIGLLCGFINGAIVIWLRMHPFIVTLATMSIFRWGCLKWVKEGSLPYGDRSLPDAFTDHFIAWEVHYRKYGGRVVESLQPMPMILMLVCMVLVWMYLQFMVWGRETYAVGGNEEASRFSGIRVQWAKMRVYLISGLCAGIAGMISCGFYKSAATNTGEGYELMVIAAAVVGGASLTGGRGTALGAVLGMLVIQLISNGISVLRPINLGFTMLPVSTEDTKLIVGIAIIVAVAVDQLSAYFQRRQMALRRILLK